MSAVYTCLSMGTSCSAGAPAALFSALSIYQSIFTVFWFIIPTPHRGAASRYGQFVKNTFSVTLFSSDKDVSLLWKFDNNYGIILTLEIG